MRRNFNNIVSVSYTFFRLLPLKMIHFKRYKFGLIERISPNVVLEFNNGSFVNIGNKTRIHSGTKIKVRKNANLVIHENVKINYNCIIACRDSIVIGAGTEFGPNVMLFDHDHNYKSGLNVDSSKETFLEAPIVIGKNCWIGAGTIILRGTKIGDNCVIAAGSIVKGNIPDNCVFIQKRRSELL